VVNNDPLTPTLFDNKYYDDVLVHDGLFTSDAALLTGTTTSDLVDSFAKSRRTFFSQFGKSFVEMGKITSGKPGNIRKSCQSFN
jgi:peroxidase